MKKRYSIKTTALLTVLTLILGFNNFSLYSQSCSDIEAFYKADKYKKGMDLAKNILEKNPNESCALKLLFEGLNNQKLYGQTPKYAMEAYTKNKSLPTEVLEEISLSYKWKDKVGLEKGGLTTYQQDLLESLIPKLLADENINSAALLNLFYYLKTFGFDTRVRPMTDVYDRRGYNDIRFEVLMDVTKLFCKKANLNDVNNLDVFDYVCSMVEKNIMQMKLNDDRNYSSKQILNDSIISSYFSKGKCFSGKYVNDVKREIDNWNNAQIRDKKYFIIKNNPASLADNELKDLFTSFSEEKETVRALHALEQIYLRNENNSETSVQFLSLLASIPDDLYVSASKVFKNTTDKMVSLFKNNAAVKNQYGLLLIRHKLYQEAHDFLRDETDLECKKTFFRSKLYVKTMEEAFEYAIKEKIPYPFITEKLFVVHEKSADEVYNRLFDFIITKYPTHIDSLRILELGFMFWRDGTAVGYDGPFKSLSETDLQKKLKIYNQKGLFNESYHIEYAYWSNKRPTTIELSSLVTKKMIKPEIAGEIIKKYGDYYEERSSMSDLGHDGIKKALEYYHIAEKYSKCDGELFLSIGDCYFIISQLSKSQIYYKKAESCGVDVASMRSGGAGKNTQRGSRGGKYYINKNGNKTYIQD